MQPRRTFWDDAEAYLPLLQLSPHPGRLFEGRGEERKRMKGKAEIRNPKSEDRRPKEGQSLDNPLAEGALEEASEGVGYDFGLKRRSFMQILGAGLLVAASVFSDAGATPWRARWFRRIGRA